MTIKDVAEYCGVSVSTVSRALNGHPDVSKEVRAKVLEAARTLHYVPNKSARDLAMTHAETIGMVVRGATNPFYTPIVEAVQTGCEAAGYSVTTRQLSTKDDEVREAAELAQTKRLKGVVMLGGRFDYSEDDAASIGVPFVCCSYSNHFGDLSKDSYSSVSINDVAEAYKATKALIDRGHRKIAALVFSTDDQSVSQLRYMGYQQAMRDAGLPLDPRLVLQTDGLSMSDAYEVVRDAIGRGVDFTAIFAIADTLAIAAIKAIYDSGSRVPEDYSVIAIDGIEMSLYTVPTLTTLCQPQVQMGKEAARIMVSVLQGKSGTEHVRLKTSMRMGGTLGRSRDQTAA